MRKVWWWHRGRSLGSWVKAVPQGWSPGTSPRGCFGTRTRTCPFHFPGEQLTLFPQGLLKWGHYDLTFQNCFLLLSLKRTLSQAEQFLSPNPTEDPTYQAPKILLSPSLARWMLGYFYKAMTSIAIKVLKHMGALPSFRICLLLRKSIYGLKKTQY